jgi:hypothetical protein
MRLFYLLLVNLLPLFSFAQYQNRPATITDRQNNSQSGLLTYKDWARSPTFIDFTPATGSDALKISAKAIQTLVLENGAVYEGLFLTIPYYMKEPVSTGNNIIHHTDSTYYLAELLVDGGIVKLYRFFDDNTDVRFAVSKNDSLVLLHNITVPLVKHNTTYSFSDPAFRRELKAILSECPTLKTDQVHYTESSLIELLKEYVSFCRLDTKVYLEQKNLGKIIPTIGIFGAYWPVFDNYVVNYGASLQLLLPRRFQNVFILLDVGRFKIPTDTDEENLLSIGLYAGRYFGRHAWQGKLYTGLSNVAGPLDTGVGLSYRKIISAELRYPILGSLLSGSQEDEGRFIKPLVMMRASIPLTSSRKR